MMIRAVLLLSLLGAFGTLMIAVFLNNGPIANAFGYVGVGLALLFSLLFMFVV